MPAGIGRLQTASEVFQLVIDPMKSVLQVCAVTVVLTAFYAVAVGWSFGTVASSILTASTLAFACDGIGSTKRIERIAILTLLYWGLSYVSNLVEALYFQVVKAHDAWGGVVSGLGVALVAACVLDWLRPAGTFTASPSQVQCAPRLWWRIPLVAVLFFVLYVAAGAAIFHWVASFYRDRPLPSLEQLFLLQVGRGLFDIGCIFPLLLRWNGSRRSAAWLSACIFTVLCGWGPLLLPNRFMPGPIRLAHGIEIGAFGIAFGIVAAMLLLKPRRLACEEDTASDFDFAAV